MNDYSTHSFPKQEGNTSQSGWKKEALWAERCSIKESVPGWHSAQSIAQLEQYAKQEKWKMEGIQ